MSPTRLTAMLAVAAIAALTVLLAVPPWMVIDADAPGVRHVALGHHPFWRPPTPETAEEVLARRAGPPREGTRPSLQVRVNRVRLGIEIAGAAAVTAGLSGVLAWRRRRLDRP